MTSTAENVTIDRCMGGWTDGLIDCGPCIWSHLSPGRRTDSDNGPASAGRPPLGSTEHTWRSNNKLSISDTVTTKQLEF